MLTIQEIFDKAAIHLLQQRTQAIDTGGHCAYRGIGEMKCAVGALINDEDYSPEIEGKSVRAIEVRAALEKAGVNTNDSLVVNLLSKMQAIHDLSLPHDWFNLLRGLAADFRLSDKELLMFREKFGIIT